MVTDWSLRMYTSTRFAVAVHTLAFIATRCKSCPAVTSNMVAESVNTNPVVIRRILGSLRQAHLVDSQPGSGGGWTMARPADAITLREIYRAVEGDPLFALHRRPNSRCDVGRHIVGILDSYFRDAEKAMEEKLGRVTVAAVMRQVGTPPRRARAVNEKGSRFAS